MFGHAFFSLLHCGLHSFKMLHNKWCSPHYVCIMWKETITKLVNQKMKDVYFPQHFSYVVSILAKNLFWYVFWSFDEVLCITSLSYNTSHMISTHLYLYKHILSDIQYIFQKMGKWLKHLKCTYLSNYLNKMKKKIK
jgi:hypothetical protein